MEPEPEDEESGSEQPAEEESEGVGVVASIAGHDVAAGATTLDASGWRLTAAQMREVAVALPKLLCLQELILDSLPVSGTTPKDGDFRYGVKTLDADLDMFRAFCEGLRACSRLTSLSLKKCYLGAQALAVLADLIKAMAALEAVNLDDNYIDASGFKTVVEGAVSVKHLSVSGNPICCTGISTERPSTGDYIVVLASMVVVQVKTDDKSSKPFKDNNGAWHKETDVLKCSGTVGEIWDSACSALAGTSLESIGLSKCGLNPESLALLAKAISSMAALTTLRCGSNLGIVGKLHPSGGLKTPDVHIEALQELLNALKPSGVTELDISAIGIGPTSADRVADYVRDARAVLTDVNASGNPLTGGSVYDGIVYDGEDISGVSVLFPVMTKVITLNVSNCGLGPTAMPELSKLVRDASAVVKKVVLSQNKLFGANQYGNHTVDANQSGWAALCDALPGSPVEELDVADVGMGVTGVTSLAKAMSAGAAVKKVVLSENKLFGDKAYDELNPHIRVHDVDANQSGWSALCDALPGSPLEELIVADIGMGVTGVTSLAKAISSMAVLTSLTVDSTGVMTDEYGRSGRGTQKTYTLTAGEASIDLSSKNLGPADVTLLTGWMQRPEVSAAIASLTCHSTGSSKDHRVYTLDAQVDCIDLGAKNLSHADLNLLMAWLARPNVATSRVNLSHNSTLEPKHASAAIASAHKQGLVIHSWCGWCSSPHFDDDSASTWKGDRVTAVDAVFVAADIDAGHVKPNSGWATLPGIVDLIDKASEQGAEHVALTLIRAIGVAGALDKTNKNCAGLAPILVRHFNALAKLGNSWHEGVERITVADGAQPVTSVAKGVVAKGHFEKEGRLEVSDEDSFYEVVSIDEDDDTVQVATLVTGQRLDFTINISDLKTMYQRRDVRVPQQPTAAEQFGRWLESLGVPHPYMAAEVATGQLLYDLPGFLPDDRQWINPLDALCDAVQQPFEYEGLLVTADDVVDLLEIGLDRVYKDDPGPRYRGKTEDQIEKQMERRRGTASEAASDGSDDSEPDENDWIRDRLRTALISNHVRWYALFEVMEVLQAAAAAHLDSRSSETIKMAMGSPVHQLKYWGDTFGTLLLRYRIVGYKVHSSKTCLVIFAFDLLEEERVALKLMANADEWQREIDMRQLPSNNEQHIMSSETDGATLDASHVVTVLDYVQLDAADIEACTESSRLEGPTPYIRMLIMPQARRDLSDLLSHDRVAGHDKEQVVSILRQIVKHLQYLHDICGRIHGDLKPRNIVEIELADGTLVWILIDLDASCALGALAGQKVTSTAYFPPEMARRQLNDTDSVQYYSSQREPQPITHYYSNAYSCVSTVEATVQFEMWYLGLLLLQMSTRDAPTLWQSTQADNILEAQDMQTLAYYWDTVKHQKIGTVIRSESKKWVPAADLSLWLLQEKASRRPKSMQQVLAHRFFQDDGSLYCFDSVEETMPAFVQRQTEALTVALNAGNSEEVQELFDHGGVHVKMADSIIRSAFVGDAAVMQVLLNEIADAWPEDVRKDYLDQRTSLGLTAYMIACACGNQDIAALLVAKGCSTDLRNDLGQTGHELAAAAAQEHEQATVTPYRHAATMHRSCQTLEEFLDMLTRRQNVHVDAGLRVWHAKQYVGHFDADQMDALLVAILNQMTKTRVVALHFTDMDCGRLITHSLGIRASTVGQLGGGVSVCLKTLTDFGWKDGKDGVSFAKAIGLALWGSKWHEVLPLAEKTPDSHSDFGKFAKKLECVFIVSVPDAEHRDSGRILPGREDVYIIPKTDCIAGALLNEADTGMYLSNTNIEAMLILKQPDSVDLDATRVQITSGRDDNGGMKDVQMAAVDAGASISDTLVGESFPPKVLRCTAAIVKAVVPQTLVLQQHHMLEQQHVGKRLWLENVSRFKASEMKAGIKGVDEQLLHSQTLAFCYCSNEMAQQMCHHGIAATVSDDGNCSLTMCLRTPSELGWQKNAAGAFRSNVADMLEGVDKDDVQAMLILTVPTEVIRNAGCEGKDTFTFKEQVGELEFLSKVEEQIVYAKAHVTKVYELEPASLVDARKALIDLRAGETLTDEFVGKTEEQIQRDILELLSKESGHAISVEEGVPPGAANVQSLQQRIAAQEERVKSEKAELAALKAQLRG